jgi:hypothetical protein
MSIAAANSRPAAADKQFFNLSPASSRDERSSESLILSKATAVIPTEWPGYVQRSTTSRGSITAWLSVAAGPFLVLLLAASVLTGAAALRSFEYDEAYSLFLTSGIARPVWPVTPFTAGSVRQLYDGDASFASIARDLRQTDVHPPLYFWSLAVWRAIWGKSLFVARLYSVLCGLGALAAVAGIARCSGIPAAAAMMITLGCYGFAYTCAIARGFALAQMLALSGVLLALLAARQPPQRRTLCGANSLTAGMLLGAASFTNYLASFVGAATLLWLLIVRFRQPRIWVAATCGFLAAIPGVLWFFLAQHGS